MKKIIPKILAVVGIVCVLVACLVVPSSAYVGSSGLSSRYDSFMTPRGVVTTTYDSVTQYHYHGANAFQPLRGIQGVDLVNGDYIYRYVSNNNNSNYDFIIRPTAVPNNGVVAWNQASYNFGSYYVNLDWCRDIGAFDTSSSGINAFYCYVSPEKVISLGDSDAWVFANEISLALPCYELSSSSSVTEVPRLEFKNLIITFVTRHDISGWNEGSLQFNTNELSGYESNATEVTITVDGASVYSGVVGYDFRDFMVLDYFNHIMTHKESFGLTAYNYKFTDSTPFNWRVWGNSTRASGQDVGFDYYRDLRFTVPQHTAPLPTQIQTNESNGYDLAEYDVSIDPWDWLIQSASSFLSTPIFPNLVGSPTFGSLLLIFLVVPIIIAFLKLWVGG
jgi:hypothetical protein